MPDLTIHAASKLSKYTKENLIEEFIEGRAAVYSENGWGFLDEKGNEVIEMQYDGVSSPCFSDGLAFVGKNGKYGFIDKNGNEVVKVQYDGNQMTREFSEGDGLISFVKNGQFIYVNRKGKEVLKVKYDVAWDFSDGLAAVGKKEKYGFFF